MSNKLLSMSLQELWRLFPIRLVPHDPRWSEYFRQEREILRGLLRERDQDPPYRQHRGKRDLGEADRRYFDRMLGYYRSQTAPDRRGLPANERK
ncbi:hypothetical protein [uncultured Campylobacter sp.]|uniref:hypothetical protein n=1 Tax=uncultured Campylobacter sp. TaxID=218934 RepID=UPI00262A405D|nr:hypothetical protein [uncultured Campylobacter sp.]